MEKREFLETLSKNGETLDKETLSGKGIFELRFIARKLGVKSPTTLSKNALVEQIFETLEKGVFNEPSGNRGRPPIESFFEKQSEAAFEASKQNNQTINAAPQMQGRGGAPYNQIAGVPNNTGNGSYGNGNWQGGNYAPGYVPNGAQNYNSGGYNQNPNYGNPQNYVPNQGYGQNRNQSYVNNGNGRNYGYQQQNGKGRFLNETPPMAFDADLEVREGILDIHPEGGYGFIRVKNCEYDEKDAYIHNSKIKKIGLRAGDVVKGQCRTTTDGKPSMVIVTAVNGIPVEEFSAVRPYFDDLKPIFPDEKLTLECQDSRNDFAIRSTDLIAPIGKGQRALIVSPPKAGKTTLLKNIAKGISNNYPEVMLLVLLIDERPEEVTDIQRSIKGEVIYSTFDETPEHHIMAAEILLNKAKRQVELGKDVVILMDSLTRLARAYNATIPPTGRTLSGGIDPGALQNPKKFFGAARNVENGGSLTIVATALIDTGSRMDDVIYEEFKGTGNMEIHLDRRLAEKRIFPAIDLNRSGTRREDLLLSQEELEAMWGIRKLLSAGETIEATEKLMSIMMKTKNNTEFVEQINILMQGMKK
ncbi:MAG: transcription termination factor Rho [Clostridiales bacterium]|jgi:transcription termination factor Rho|nr:transcription termination factor Rho [Clostridiales bacterium]